MTTYGLTSAGFITKDLQTIKTELETEFKNSFGQDKDISAESIPGQLIGNKAIKLANLWELSAAIVASFNPDTTVGKSLDGACALIGVERLEARRSTVAVVLYGTLGTVVPLNHRTTQSSTNEDFLLSTATTIATTSLADTYFELVTKPPVTGTVYTVTINGVGHTYTAIGGDTEAMVLTGIQNAINAGTQPVTAAATSTNCRVYADDGKTPFSCSLTVTLVFTIYGTPGNYTAENTGAIAVTVGSVNLIRQAVVGLNSVNNLAAGVIGRAVEGDDELRIRRRASLGTAGFATDEAIRSRVLQEVADVTYCRVISNRTGTVDGGGRPAKSFETVVQGGVDADIANKIWGVGPAGIETFGTTTVVIQDSTGSNQTIKFSRPQSIYIWIDAVLTLSAEITFPTTGIVDVKAAIVAWALSALTVGTDVIFTQLYVPIHEVQGIAGVALTIGWSTNPAVKPSMGTANISISDTQIAIIEAPRMGITAV